MINVKLPYVKVDTNNTTLLFKVETCKSANYYSVNPYTHVATLYYGERISDFDNYDVFGKNPMLIDRVGGAMDDFIQVRTAYSTPGMGMNKESSLIVENVDGTCVNRFEFVSAEVKKGGIEFDDMPYSRNGSETLILSMSDEHAGLTLKQYYTVFDDSDVIAVCQELINNNKNSVCIKKISSLQCDLPDTEWTVSTFDGAWGSERFRHKTKISAGVFSIDSKIGASSSGHNPFFTLEGSNLNNNKYAFNFIYSGNHKEQVDISYYGTTRVLVGINDYLFNYELKGGESFITPQAIMVTDTCSDVLTGEMHKFVLNHIINPDFKNYERPVLYNHWEGTGIKFNEELLLELADIAKDVGVELFVMDDGWFGERYDDTTSLGDWYVNKNKFPNGLKGLSDGIKQRGMKFGIWVEPEMISKNSNIYRSHPEYAVEIPNRNPIERRCQLMIDMSNPDVIEYLYNSLTAVFDECKPDYVKWDYNRQIHDTYSHNDFKWGEWYHKMILGSYKLIGRLVKRYPNVLFESCSSGGCRYDLGMFFYMPQTWGSDDTNTVMRTYIQCGTLQAYPQSTFGAHVTKDHCGMASGVSSIEDRFNLNSVGAFGYEFDFRQFNETEIEMMKKQVAYYKEHRKLMQFGKYICLDNVFDNGKNYSYMIVAEDKSEAMLTVVEKEYIACKLPKLYRLKGLDANAVYSLSQRPQSNVEKENEVNLIAKGDALMKYGIDLDFPANTTDLGEYGSLRSRMYYIKRIK